MPRKKTSRPLRIGINGYGRIGRCVLRALVERKLFPGRVAVMTINDPAGVESMAYLTRFDSTHGRFPVEVGNKDDTLIIGRHGIGVSHGRTPGETPWNEARLDLLFECSGSFNRRDGAEPFFEGGVPRLLVSHPMVKPADADATIVYGVNHDTLTGSERIVSTGSCTTNCIVPVLAILDEAFGVERATITTLHSVMNDQPLIDGFHNRDLRLTRSAMQSIVPVTTKLALGVERLLPALSGRLQAKALRVPTLNVSAISLAVELGRDCTADGINALMQHAVAGAYTGLLDYTDLPHASIDFIHDARSAIIDGSQTHVVGGRMADMLLWFDNEWGYANRMIDTALYWLERTGTLSGG